MGFKLWDFRIRALSIGSRVAEECWWLTHLEVLLSCTHTEGMNQLQPPPPRIVGRERGASHDKKQRENPLFSSLRSISFYHFNQFSQFERRRVGLVLSDLTGEPRGLHKRVDRSYLHTPTRTRKESARGSLCA